ncbi:hypothetical protein ACSS6W_005703 [Trichoderma asperelloides]
MVSSLAPTIIESEFLHIEMRRYDSRPEVRAKEEIWLPRTPITWLPTLVHVYLSA